MQEMTEFLMTFLLNAFWQTALIILAAITGTRLLRDAGSRFKHVIWVSALVLSMTFPLLTAGWINAPEVIARTNTTPIKYEQVEPVGTAIIVESVSDTPVAPVVPTTIPVSSGLAFGILAIYALFVIYRTAALMSALLFTSAIRRRAYAGDLPANIHAAIDQCGGILDHREVNVLFSNEVPVPVTVGWLRPVIILPDSFLRETDANVLTTAVGHEMVHVARRDYAVNLFFEIVSLPISFHPAVAYAKRRIAQMRELCCDEVVASRLLNADIYARSLLNIAGSASPLDRLSPMITVGITDNRNLEVRIMSLLKRSEMSPLKKGLLALAALAVLAVPLVMAAYLSPDVTITSAAVQPEAQPTVPVETERDQEKASRAVLELRMELEKKLVEIKTALADPNMPDQQRAALKIKVVGLESQLRELDRLSSVGPIQGLERKLEWLKAALQDPKVNDFDRAKIMQDIESLERELAERKISETDQGARVERLRRQLVEVTVALRDSSLNEAQKYELRAMEAKLRNELDVLETGRSRPIVVAVRAAEGDDDDKWDYPDDMDSDMDTPRSRSALERLKKEACLTEEEAAAKALAAYPGKLVDKELGQIKGEVAWRFYIIDAAATPDSNTQLVHVSAIDGRIIKATRAHVTVSFDAKHPGEKITRKGKKPE